MDARTRDRLCYDLLAAEDEGGAIMILRRAGVWDDPGTWRFFGGQENNFSTIGNQQANAEAALVEKLVNSIDAVLTLECRRAGIDPEGDQAPRSIRDAVAQFFGIRDGRISELTASELTKHAARIALIASGTKRRPNLTVVDSGEGQAPDDFPQTFLSLGRSNKLKIPFVQGKFNMGGTGVLQFCGRNNLQLIVSRRNPEISFGADQWGFTLVRRQDPAGSVRSSVYTYLVIDGRVPHLSGRGPLDIESHLDKAGAGGSALAPLQAGTVIKLYDFQLAGGLKTNILFDLFNRISCLLPDVALPIRFYERRAYRGHSLESTMVGLSARLDKDSRDNLEFDPTVHEIAIGARTLRAKVYAFRRREDGGSAAEKFRSREGILFVVNGQAHGHIDKAFFRRGRVNMSYIAEDLLVIVDASDLDGRDREDLFMNSRDRLRDGDLRREIEIELEQLVSGHELLRALRARRREEAMAKKLSDDKALEELLGEIIKKSPSLSSLFITGQRASGSVGRWYRDRQSAGLRW